MEESKAPVYKKPWLWIAVSAVLLGAAAWIFFVAVPISNSAKTQDELYGNYKFEEQIYMNPLSSFLAFEGFEEYYTLAEDTLTITSASGEQRSVDIKYEFLEVDEKNFEASFIMDLDGLDISQYKQRYQLELCAPSEHSNGYTLYAMDDEIWLARVSSGKLGDRYFWSIYKIERYGGVLPEQAEESVIIPDYFSLIEGKPDELCFDEPHIETLTVVSGDNSVDVAGHVICTQFSYQSHIDDSNRLTPRQVADSIQYLPIEIDPNTYMPFIPLINGEVVDGNYTVYDMNFKNDPVDTPSSEDSPRKIRKELFNDMVWPGKYIVEVEVIFEEGDMATFVQYFFGVILPEKSE